jgi:hypothetical protein
MNVTLRLQEPRRHNGKVTKKTISTCGREYDVQQRVERIVIRCGPYDNSDFIEIVNNDGVIDVLFNPIEGQPNEPALSVIEEAV